MEVILVGGTGVLSKDVAKQSIESKIDLYMINRGNRLRYVSEGANIIVGDINNPGELSNKLSEMEFDVVVDFLSYTPEQLTRNLKLFRNKCKQYIFISSATAYSTDYPEQLINEDTPLTNYEWGYSRNKILCEELMEEEYNKSGLQYTIVRPYITYGDTRIPYAFISKKQQWTLVDRILNGKPVVVWDEGKNLCTLTHTEDFAKGVVGLFMNPKAFRQAFHITSDEHLTWVEVLEKIAEVVGKKAQIAYIPSKTIEKSFKEMRGELSCDKALTRKFDNSKIKSVVSSFTCKIKFSEGIKKTIEHYQIIPELMKIDHEWNAKVDVLTHQYFKKNAGKLIGKGDIGVSESNKGTQLEFLINIAIVLYYKIRNRISWFTRGVKNRIKRIVLGYKFRLKGKENEIKSHS
jgi:nucleoside-diphosphate-sugar epimerase